MRYKRISVGDGDTNCYIIFSETEKKVMLIDPAFEQARIKAETEGCSVEKVVLTHGHIDHIYDCMAFDAPVYICEDDAEYLTNRELNSPYNIFPELETRAYTPSGFLHDGDKVCFCEYIFEVIQTPGHTPGLICLYGENTLFCGDLIFFRSIGRTDFPRGDNAAMAASLKKVMALPDETVVCPGHYRETQIGYEKKYNEMIGYLTENY